MNRKTAFHPTRYKAPLAVALTSCLAVLSACKDDSVAITTPQTYGANYSGLLKTSLGNFELKPTTCGLFREGDFDDIEIQGPGVAPDGEVLFFHLSSTGEELSVHLGVDSAMAHSDRTLKAGRWHSEPFTIQTSGNGRQFTVPDIALVDSDQKRIEGLASLEIDCSTP